MMGNKWGPTIASQEKCKGSGRNLKEREINGDHILLDFIKIFDFIHRIFGVMITKKGASRAGKDPEHYASTLITGYGKCVRLAWSTERERERNER